MIEYGRWVSVEQIRKQRRMRRQTVIEAMLSGDLPFEQRDRVRFARACDVEAWEERRLTQSFPISSREIAPELLDLA